MFIKKTTEDDLQYWQERLDEANAKLNALKFLVDVQQDSGVTAELIAGWRKQLQDEKQIFIEFYAEALYKLMYPLKWPLSLLYKKEEK